MWSTFAAYKTHGKHCERVRNNIKTSPQVWQETHTTTTSPTPLNPQYKEKVIHAIKRESLCVKNKTVAPKLGNQPVIREGNKNSKNYCLLSMTVWKGTPLSMFPCVTFILSASLQKPYNLRMLFLGPIRTG